MKLSHLVLVRSIFILLHLSLRLHVHKQTHLISESTETHLLGVDGATLSRGQVATLSRGQVANTANAARTSQEDAERWHRDGLHSKSYLHHRLGMGKDFVKGDVSVILELQQPLHLKH
jgi:hypothetical protein